MIDNEEKHETKNTRNNRLYMLEGICTFLVIELHVTYILTNEFTQNVFFNISRMAVPVFFMISGYYLWDTNPDNVQRKLIKRILRNTKLFGLVLLFYCILNICLNGMEHFVVNVSNWDNVFKFVLLNWTTPFAGCGHLWYLLALIYDYALMWVVNKYGLYKLAGVLSSILLIAVYVAELLIFQGYPILEIHYRNFLFLGFPLIMIGNLIGKYETKIKGIFGQRPMVLNGFGIVGGVFS